MAADAVVYVVDDDDAIRDSLAALLESHGYVTRCFDSGQAFMAADADSGSGCVLLDVRMPDIDGLTIQKSLAERNFPLPVIIITGHGDVPMAVKAMKDGAFDFIEKPFTDDSLTASVEAAIAHGADARASRKTSLRANGADAFAPLTPRERDVLMQLLEGQPNKIIAYNLGISARTVEVHRARVMEKTGAKSLSHLVRMALAAGIDPDGA
jgi:two-component system response regulator FixJ